MWECSNQLVAPRILTSVKQFLDRADEKLVNLFVLIRGGRVLLQIYIGKIPNFTSARPKELLATAAVATCALRIRTSADAQLNATNGETQCERSGFVSWVRIASLS
jgi:hypothetical protein